MTPPPIRYPLPLLVVILVAGLMVWKGEAWSRRWRQALAEKIALATSGPPVPASDAPILLAGPVKKRVLLLRDGIEATDRPDGRVVATIRLRQFADVFDVWPTTGPPTHFRIGNRKPIGWIKAADALDWSTRLAFMPLARTLALADSPGGTSRGPLPTGDTALPVLDWKDEAVRIGVWEPDRPWSEIAGEGWLTPASEDRWGLWIGRDELLGLIGLLGRSEVPEKVEEVRLKAIVGALGSGEEWTSTEVDEVRHWLPRGVFAKEAITPTLAVEGLARINEDWTAEARWSGLTFRFLPLSALP